jgi:hypothetical protein
MRKQPNNTPTTQSTHTMRTNTAAFLLLICCVLQATQAVSRGGSVFSSASIVAPQSGDLFEDAKCIVNADFEAALTR